MYPWEVAHFIPNCRLSLLQHSHSLSSCLSLPSISEWDFLCSPGSIHHSKQWAGAQAAVAAVSLNRVGGHSGRFLLSIFSVETHVHCIWVVFFSWRLILTLQTVLSWSQVLCSFLLCGSPASLFTGKAASLKAPMWLCLFSLKESPCECKI